MRFDTNLLKLIACPETKAPLSLAPPKLLAELNLKIRAATLKTCKGEVVTEELEMALVREDGRVVYPVIEGIARLVREEGIVI